MPSRTCSEMDGYSAMLDVNPILYRNYAPSVEDRCERGGSRWSVDRPDCGKSGRKEMLTGARRFPDVTIYVGRNRIPFTVSSETLQCSSYFRSRIDRLRDKSHDPSSPIQPIVVDCEESDFQNMMSLLRYGSLEALPKLSDADLYRLKKEMEFYGIEFPIDQPKKVVNPPALVTQGFPLKTTPPTTTATTMSAASSPRHVSTSGLPDFPMELTDPAKLVLVARKDDDFRARCSCATDQTSWALSFNYRHAFCTGCSKPATTIPSKFLAEMFMAAAMFYSAEHKTNLSKWYVGGDSTCTLKFLVARSCCTCPCSMLNTVWAVSTYHSHAFCTTCGGAPQGPTLVCILLTVRYGGLHRSPTKGSKREHLSEMPITRETPKLQPAPVYKNRVRLSDTLPSKSLRS